MLNAWHRWRKLAERRRPRLLGRQGPTAPATPSRLSLERLEDRLLLTTLFVDDDWGSVNPGDDPDAGGPATEFGTDAFASIQAAVNAASDGDTIIVNAGTYVENVSIAGKSLTLISASGRDVTTIEGVTNAGVHGTIFITGTTNGLRIGEVDQGFTIIGKDGAPGQENGAVYLDGTHTGTIVEGNEIVAKGDAGLMTVFGSTISGLTVNNNLFSGKTYLGDQPAGDGFGQQFTLLDVPRQLVLISGGTGGGNHSNITFTNNNITGTAGGFNSDGNEQGNTLVTIDSHGALITGNTFAGTTTRFSSALRARGDNAVITGNTFDASHMTAATNYMFLQGSGQLSVDPVTLENVIQNNTFSQAAVVTGGNTIDVGYGNITTKVAGNRVMLGVSNASLTHSVQIEFTGGGIVFSGVDGTTINGLASVTINSATIKTIVGKLGNGVDIVDVTGNAARVNLDLAGGANSITFEDYSGDAMVKVTPKNGSLTFTGHDSDFKALQVNGGNVGIDKVTLDGVTVSAKTAINLQGGDNRLVVLDSTFAKAVSFTSKGPQTDIQIEVDSNGTGTQFQDSVTVNVGASATIKVAAPGATDSVAFAKKVTLKSAKPNSTLDVGANVTFNKLPKLTNITQN